MSFTNFRKPPSIATSVSSNCGFILSPINVHNGFLLHSRCSCSERHPSMLPSCWPIGHSRCRLYQDIFDLHCGLFTCKMYSLRHTKSVVLTFKFCHTESIVLACNKIHLIKIIPSTKRALHRKTHRANQIFSRYYFSNSNAYAFIEDPENQINNTIFNHNCYK